MPEGAGLLRRPFFAAMVLRNPRETRKPEPGGVGGIDWSRHARSQLGWQSARAFHLIMLGLGPSYWARRSGRPSRIGQWAPAHRSPRRHGLCARPDIASRKSALGTSASPVESSLRPTPRVFSQETPPEPGGPRSALRRDFGKPQPLFRRQAKCPKSKTGASVKTGLSSHRARKGPGRWGKKFLKNRAPGERAPTCRSKRGLVCSPGRGGPSTAPLPSR